MTDTSDPVLAGESQERILIVDDEEGIRSLLTELFKSIGWYVRVAGSLAGAQRELAQQQFRVMIIDWKLPDGSGVEFVTSLSEETRSRMGIVVISGFLLPSLPDGVRGMRKPFNLSDLLGATEALARM